MRTGSNFADGKPREACGVIGVFGHPQAAEVSGLGLHALQHRGQESAGIAASHNGRIRVHRGMGLVNQVFGFSGIAHLEGSLAIGHTRYSTSGASTLTNAQPLMLDSSRGQIAIAHNGTITNAGEIRARLQASGTVLQTDTDTEAILHLIARSKEPRMVDAITEALLQLRGAFSLLILTGGCIYAVRDPYGFRPLSMGIMAGAGRGQEAIVFASETVAFDLIGAAWERDVQPREIVIAGDQGVSSVFYGPRVKPAGCIFELVYLARPDSVVFGRSVASARDQMGRRLAIEAPAEADVVIPVPDSGVTAAIGYSAQSGIPFRMGLIRSHYAGRTFIQPEQRARELAVKLKLNPVRSFLDGKRVVLVDDSVVRGTTSRQIVQMIRKAGAREVHLRVASPPFIAPCPYGIDTPTTSELIAAGRSSREIQAFIGVDSVAYLSMSGLLDACGDPKGENFCTCCFGGEDPAEQTGKDELVSAGCETAG